MMKGRGNTSEGLGKRLRTAGTARCKSGRKTTSLLAILERRRKGSYWGGRIRTFMDSPEVEKRGHLLKH